MEDLRETLRAACLAGPDALRSLVRDRGLRLAIHFNGTDNPSILEEVLKAIVLHGAPLALLDTLEEQFPGLELNWRRNGMTEIIRLERGLASAFETLKPDSKLRDSITAVVHSVIRRMGPNRINRMYRIEETLSGSHEHLPKLALDNLAYYVFGALGQNLSLFVDSVLILPRYMGGRYISDVNSKISPVAQEVLLDQLKSAQIMELYDTEKRLLDLYNEFYTGKRMVSMHMPDQWLIASTFQINLQAIREELCGRRYRMVRMVLLVNVKGRTSKGRSLPFLPDSVMRMIMEQILDVQFGARMYIHGDLV